MHNSYLDKPLPVQENKKKTKVSRLKDEKTSQVRNSGKLNRDEIVNNLTGRTLMIYFVLLNKKSIGVRELHENRNGIYYLDRKADLPLLTSWVLIGRRLIPKVIFAAIFFTFLFIGYLIFIYSNWNKDSLFVILFGVIIMVYIWLDVILQFKHKPI
jgi:hypothetical protein